jgi:tRNA 2-thiouridine synthesizing protein A
MTKTIDAKGLQCPQPRLMMTMEATRMKPGDILECVADCSTFASDVRSWCQNSKKSLLWLREEGNGLKRCQVRI